MFDVVVDWQNATKRTLEIKPNGLDYDEIIKIDTEKFYVSYDNKIITPNKHYTIVIQKILL